jgi:muramoyltetrapeptide carboxypeptidase
MLCNEMQKLKKGDIVDIVAPASAKNEAEYEKALDFVRNFGLEPRARSYSELIKTGLCANSTQYRFEHLMEALQAKDSKAVWCLCGGYGSQQLLGMLDGVTHPPEQKMFIGFSDITILLNYFADKWGWTCLHGPMPGQVGKVHESTWQNLSDIIFGDNDNVSFPTTPLNKAAAKARQVEGKFMGGCLSLMQALVGTPQMPDLNGTVLMLEDDRFETPRRIDRILDHMQRAGSFDKVAAVVLGNFLEDAARGSKDERELEEVLGSFAAYLDKMDIPLIQNVHLGHTQDMLTVPIGSVAKVNLGDKTEVIIRG